MINIFCKVETCYNHISHNEVPMTGQSQEKNELACMTLLALEILLAMRLHVCRAGLRELAASVHRGMLSRRDSTNIG